MKGFDAGVMAMLLGTKNAEQCRLFYNAHIKFLKEAVQIKGYGQRIKALKTYMGINVESRTISGAKLG